MKGERTRIYEAEDEARRLTKATSEAGRRFLPTDPAGYIAWVQTQAWFRAAYPNQHEPVDIQLKGKGSAAYGRNGARLIRVGSNHRKSAEACEWACLHELAHIVTPKLTGNDGHANAWRVAYVFLVRRALGHRAAKYLIQQFIAKDLPYRDHPLSRHPGGKSDGQGDK